MILVTGTFRSGTSMWMQVLQAAGLPLIGTAYPAHWGDVLSEFNEQGFHESRLRDGIWWRTNPHPQTGAYLFPQQTRRHLVKVFAKGLTHTDVAFIDFVVVTLRDWRSFTRSFDAIHQRELAWYKEHDLEFPGGAEVRPIPYQWWSRNFALIRDIATRRHQARFTTYDRVIRDPRSEVLAMLDRLGIDDTDARDRACSVVRTDMRTPRPPHADEERVTCEDAEVFDALFETVDQGRPLGVDLIERLNATEQRIRERFGD